jgi:hypothetical protein
MADALERGADRAIVPSWPWSLVAPFMKILPDVLWDRFNKP